MSAEDTYKKLPVIGFIINQISDADIDYGPLAFFMALTLLIVGLFVLGVSSGNVVSLFFATIPIWLPITLFFIFFNKWNEFKGIAFYLQNGRTTLRIKLPQEVLKSPEAMEFVLSQIHNTQNPDNLMQTYLDGKRPLPFSLELVSIGGEVRFYVNVPTKKTKDAFEVNMYAQYPGIIIEEEPVDYAGEIPLDTKEYGTFTARMGKKENDVYPIKTYVDYKLDGMPKEEEKVDPMTPMLEVLASIKPNERLYIQFIITSVRKTGFKFGQLTSSQAWDKKVKEEINKLMQRDPKTKAPLSSEATDFDGSPRITPGERDLVSAMERNVEKYAYSVGIRWTYIFPEGNFDGNLPGRVIRSFSQYDKIGQNGIGARWRTDFNYKDLFPGKKEKEISALKKGEFKAYKLRKYGPMGASDTPKIFTTEELATLFHIPGRVAVTPNLSRIESSRSEAPSNLPIAPA